MPIFEKYFFYIFSIYLLLRGASIIILATSVLLSSQNSPIGYHEEWLKEVAILLKIVIITGGILVIFAICSGVYSILFFDNAKFKKRCTCISCTTVMFAIFFSIMLIVQSAAGIYMFILVLRPAAELKRAFKNYGYQWEDTNFVNHVQRKLQCCGIYSYRDYQEILNIPIPDSCCYNLWETCIEDSADSQPGCAFEINTSGFTYVIYELSIFIIATSLAEFMCLLLTLFLANCIRKRRKNTKKRQETYVTLRKMLMLKEHLRSARDRSFQIVSNAER